MERRIQGRRILLYAYEFIKFHGCRVPGVKGNMMSLKDSLADVESAVDCYRGVYYRLFAYMKCIIESNNFDFNKRMKELYPKKSV